jgi:lipopolysaccharide biosynthesis glycosyltransferase
MEKYNIVFATDQNYIQHLSVALISLLSNNSSLDFKIFIISSGLDSDNFQKIKSITEKYKVHLKQIIINDDVFEKFVTNFHFTKAMYYRLLIPNFIDEDKVLYLDADIVANGDIENLYNQDLQDNFIGAVLNPRFDRYEELEMDEESRYFNSGVMLINNKKWKEEGLATKVIEFIDFNHNIVTFPDQDGLNAVINGRWKEIELKYNQQAVIFEQDFSSKYNCFSEQNLIEAKNSPIIIHYTGSSKPWHFRNNHPYKYLYWKYLRMTPFKRYISEDLTVINVIKWIIPQSIKEFIKGIMK